MDWRSIRFDWNHARAFLVTAEEGSLSAAARALGMTQPTLGRQVSALEEELGITLFERVGKGLELTPTGLELLDLARTMGEAANQFSLSASGKVTTIEGNVSISATDITSIFQLPPIIGELRQREPGITIEIIATNTSSDLLRREADIAIRAFRPSQPELIIKRLNDFVGQLYATPDYLTRIGNPKTPEEFKCAEFIGFIGDTGEYPNILHEKGFPKSIQFPVTTGNHQVHWQLCIEGAGIAIMPTDVGDAEPSVVRVVPTLENFTGELWLVVHRELRTNRRVKMVYDFLSERLGPA